MRDFTIGGVLRRTMALLRAHAALLLGSATILAVVEKAIDFALVARIRDAQWSVAALAGLISWIGWLVLQIIVVRIGVDDARGQQSAPGELATIALGLFFPVAWLVVLSGLGIALASLLLVVPGMMLFCRWNVAVAVQVAERPGTLAALGRSAALTEGVRWSIFGLILVVTLIDVVISAIFGFGGGFITGVTHNPWPVLIGQAIGSALFVLFGLVANTATYLELREIREGALSHELVAVFE